MSLIFVLCSIPQILFTSSLTVKTAFKLENEAIEKEKQFQCTRNSDPFERNYRNEGSNFFLSSLIQQLMWWSEWLGRRLYSVWML